MVGNYGLLSSPSSSSSLISGFELKRETSLVLNLTAVYAFSSRGFNLESADRYGSVIADFLEELLRDFSHGNWPPESLFWLPVEDAVA